MQFSSGWTLSINSDNQLIAKPPNRSRPSRPESSQIPFVGFDVDHSTPWVVPTKPAAQATWETLLLPENVAALHEFVWNVCRSVWHYDVANICRCVCWFAGLRRCVIPPHLTGFCQSPNDDYSWLEPWPTDLGTCLPPKEKKRNGMEWAQNDQICCRLAKVVGHVGPGLVLIADFAWATTLHQPEKMLCGDDYPNQIRWWQWHFFPNDWTCGVHHLNPTTWLRGQVFWSTSTLKRLTVERFFSKRAAHNRLFFAGYWTLI